MTKVYLPEGAGPCVKAHVVATLVTADDQRFQSSNFCMNPQKVCPRVTAGFGPGEGYNLCEEICQQDAHAEVNAIVEGISHMSHEGLAGGTMYVEYTDHTGAVKPWICAKCATVCKKYGVKHVLGKPPEDFVAHAQRQWGKYQRSREIILGA